MVCYTVLFLCTSVKEIAFSSHASIVQRSNIGKTASGVMATRVSNEMKITRQVTGGKVMYNLKNHQQFDLPHYAISYITNLACHQDGHHWNTPDIT
jgi:hypothetical protein